MYIRPSETLVRYLDQECFIYLFFFIFTLFLLFKQDPSCINIRSKGTIRYPKVRHEVHPLLCTLR